MKKMLNCPYRNIALGDDQVCSPWFGCNKGFDPECDPSPSPRDIICDLDEEENLKMTAREFTEHCGYDVAEEVLLILTKWTNSGVDFSKFPDEHIPEEILTKKLKRNLFQEYIYNL